MKYDFDSNFTKRISFLLATKNRAPYLKKALSNINKLVGPDDELIIIDGNSTDGTEGIIQEYIDVIDIFVSEPDKSEAHAFNNAILLSKVKYIKLLTEDDTFYP